MRLDASARLLRRLTPCLLLALFITGCEEDAPTAPTPVEPVDPPTVTETFDGMLALGEMSCHDFTTVATGDTVLEVIDLQPLTTLTVGILLGQPDPADPENCVGFAQDTSVRLFEDFLSSNLPPGAYCTCVSDVGNIFEDITVSYTLEVIHP